MKRLKLTYGKWVWRDLNPRSTPCKGGVITTRPQTQPVVEAPVLEAIAGGLTSKAMSHAPEMNG